MQRDTGVLRRDLLRLHNSRRKWIKQKKLFRVLSQEGHRRIPFLCGFIFCRFQVLLISSFFDFLFFRPPPNCHPCSFSFRPSLWNVFSFSPRFVICVFSSLFYLEVQDLSGLAFWFPLWGPEFCGPQETWFCKGHFFFASFDFHWSSFDFRRGLRPQRFGTFISIVGARVLWPPGNMIL